MLGLFLEAQGYPLPQHSKSKSPSALSRFLNIYHWSTRGVIRTTRNRVIKEILSERPLGRKPFLQVIIDLTTLEKVGKFKVFENLIRVYNAKRGLHLVVVYLVVGHALSPEIEPALLERVPDCADRSTKQRLAQFLRVRPRRWRVPWNFRVWRGKGTASPAHLGLKMVKSLPKKLTKHFQVMVLVDTGKGKCAISTQCPKEKIPHNCWYRLYS
ncbi:hypothetical protein HW132_31415 [Brasilonema sp. CT11]|nr:hypothetical protein [Brasilonema sp. CT11]